MPMRGGYASPKSPEIFQERAKLVGQDVSKSRDKIYICHLS